MRKNLSNAHSVIAVTVLAAALFFGAAVRADIIYTVTTTGTISSGSDYGIFGGIGNLVNQTYTLTESFDDTTATSQGTASSQELNPVAGSAIVTVNGLSYAFSIPLSNNSEYLISDNEHLYGPGYYSQIVGNLQGVSGAGASVTAQSFVGSGVDDFVQNISLGQYLFYSVTANDNNGVYFTTTTDGSQFTGNVNSITLNAITPAPEPASLMLFGGGLAALGWTRRRAFKPAHF